MAIHIRFHKWKVSLSAKAIAVAVDCFVVLWSTAQQQTFNVAGYLQDPAPSDSEVGPLTSTRETEDNPRAE